MVCCLQRDILSGWTLAVRNYYTRHLSEPRIFRVFRFFRIRDFHTLSATCSNPMAALSYLFILYDVRRRLIEKRQAGSHCRLIAKIDEQKQGKGGLSGEPYRRHTLIESLSDNMFVKDTDGRFIVNNPGYVQVLGTLSQKEPVGKTDIDIFPKEMTMQVFTIEQKIIELQQPVMNQVEMSVAPQVNPQWLLAAELPLHDKQGQLIELEDTTHKRTDEALRQLLKAVETMQLGLTITDLKGKILYTNPAEATMHGYTVAELIGSDLGVFAPAELRRPMTIEQIKTMQHLRESINMRKDGSIFPVRLMSDVVEDASGNPMAIITTCEDISEHRRTTEKLRRHTRELALLNHLSDLLQTCKSEKETYNIVVKICKKLFPEDPGCLGLLDPSNAKMEVVAFWGKPPHISRRTSSNSLKASPASAPCLHEHSLCPHHCHSGEDECLSVPIIAFGEMIGSLSLCVFSDKFHQPADEESREIEAKRSLLNRISKHYALSLANLRLREKLKIEAIQDPLTGLYNRRYMEESLKREAARAKRHNTHVSILMLDVDHFKRFNDIYGHKAGDFVLHKLGEFLQHHVRGEDIACRYGGEEFLLILPDTPLNIAKQRAEELRLGIKHLKLTYQEIPIQVTISAGVAVLPNHSLDIMHTVHLSDMALYQAKANGRDQVVVASS